MVQDLSLEIRQGEVFSLLGPSGCGKTTLLRMCAGFEQPDAGRIVLDGVDITSLPPHKRPVNTVFQNYALFPYLSVQENVAFGLKIARVGRAERDRRVREAIELVQMTDYAARRPHELSGGQRQRVAIARAVVTRPRLLLLDEPLAALDLKLRQRMLLELDRIHDEVGITFLFVTHDQGEAMSLSDRLAVMNAGRIEQVGTPAQVYESPHSSFTAAFIGDTNFFEGDISEVSEDGEYSTISSEGLPPAVCYNDRPRQRGERVYLSVRPEKFIIASTRPVDKPLLNTLRGVVEDKVYLGAYTKYWVRCETTLIVVLSAHHHYLLDAPPPTWEEEVWLAWHANDGYMLDRYREQDEVLLTHPDEEYSDLQPDTQPGILIDDEEGHE